MEQEKSENKIFRAFSFVPSFLKWIVIILVTLNLMMLGTEVYPLFKTCWVCDVFKSIYDAFSIASFELFTLFKEPVVVVISFCFALWLVHQVYLLLKPSLSSVLVPDEGPKFNADFLKTIYKKIFLLVAVLGLVIFNEPKNVFSNSFELILDFGTGIGRTILRNKIDINKLPEECRESNDKQKYGDNNALSMSTRNNLSCLIEETMLIRRSYVDLGLTMVNYGLVPIITEVVKYVAARVGAFFGGKALEKYGGEAWLNKLTKNNEKLKKRLEKELDPRKQKKIQKKLAKGQETIKKASDKSKDFVKKTKMLNKTGKILVDHNKLPANIIALSGIINLYFPLIIIEFVLFLGIVFILFPVLAGCYIFEVTRNFATTSFSKTIEFSFKLIFICIAMVLCASLNDLILGGGIVKNTTELTDILNNVSSDNFTKEMLADWYFVRVFLALFFNAVVMNQMGSLAGWFGTDTNDSGLRSGIENLKNTMIKTATSVGRDVKSYAKKVIKNNKNEDYDKDKDENDE